MVIDDQQQYNRQPQRLSPRNSQFISPYGRLSPQREGPIQQYDAMTINRYIMGYPSSGYRVRPMVNSPIYNRPGQ
jgi:hypothetical protein